jgi:hypothetical protein
VEVLCATKEAADLEIQRLQAKLAKFVDEISGTGKAAARLRRGFLGGPRTHAS